MNGKEGTPWIGLDLYTRDHDLLLDVKGQGKYPRIDLAVFEENTCMREHRTKNQRELAMIFARKLCSAQ